MIPLPQNPPSKFPNCKNHCNQPSNFRQICKVLCMVIINLVKFIKLKIQTYQVVPIVMIFQIIHCITFVKHLHFFKLFRREVKMVENLTLQQVDFKVKICGLINFYVFYDFVKHYLLNFFGGRIKVVHWRL